MQYSNMFQVFHKFGLTVFTTIVSVKNLYLISRLTACDIDKFFEFFKHLTLVLHEIHICTSRCIIINVTKYFDFPSDSTLIGPQTFRLDDAFGNEKRFCFPI